MGLQFSVHHQCGRARAGVLETDHGRVRTPVFIPVGTAATVKAMTQEWLQQLGAEILLSNTYHLYLRPGSDLIEKSGGLHDFMGWKGAILTDSGGYQVFSHRELTRISEEGVKFRSYLDGSSHFITPERSVEIQQQLGADIIMAFDECTSYPVTTAQARESMLRSMRWARRSRRAHADQRQVLFGIMQGSVYTQLRRESLGHLNEIGFEGLALGGFSVGEPRELMFEILDQLSSELPLDQPRYLMGVGTPLDLLQAVELGMDMFDCVLPTRNARNGMLFTGRGQLRIKNSRYKDDERPVDPDCECFVCARYSRAYLRHLLVSREILSSMLNTFHNLHFYLKMMRSMRKTIEAGTFDSFAQGFRERYSSGC